MFQYMDPEAVKEKLITTRLYKYHGSLVAFSSLGNPRLRSSEFVRLRVGVCLGTQEDLRANIESDHDIHTLR